MRKRSRSWVMAPTVRKPLLLPRRKTVNLSPKAGAPVPSSHWAKKGAIWSLASPVALDLGDLLDGGAADTFIGVLGEDGVLRNLLKASSPSSQRSMWKIMAPFSRVIGLELGGVGVEAAEGGEGFGVVGDRTGGDIVDGGLEGVLAVGVLDVHELGVAAHAVGDPGVVEGGGGDLRTPPLVSDGVGHEALGVAGVCDARAGDGDDLGGPEGGDGIFGKLDEVEAAGFRLAESGSHELEDLVGFVGGGDGSGFAFFGDVDADVVDAGSGDGVEELARDDGAGEAGLGPVEGVLGAVGGELLFGGEAAAAADDGFRLRGRGCASRR